MALTRHLAGEAVAGSTPSDTCTPPAGSWTAGHVLGLGPPDIRGLLPGGLLSLGARDPPGLDVGGAGGIWAGQTQPHLSRSNVGAFFSAPSVPRRCNSVLASNLDGQASRVLIG